MSEDFADSLRTENYERDHFVDFDTDLAYMAAVTDRLLAACEKGNVA